MRRVNSMGFCTALILGFVLLGPFSVHAAGDPTKGTAIYQKHCLVCHGPQGKGDGPAGKSLKPPASDFTSAASKKKSAADLRRIIEEGKSGTAMIAWKSQLSPSDIDDVLGYVAVLRK
jgi:cytochrome c6